MAEWKRKWRSPYGSGFRVVGLLHHGVKARRFWVRVGAFGRAPWFMNSTGNLCHVPLELL